MRICILLILILIIIVTVIIIIIIINTKPTSENIVIKLEYFYKTEMNT